MLFCCLDVKFDMTTSNESLSFSTGIYEDDNMSKNIILCCDSFCKPN